MDNNLSSVPNIDGGFVSGGVYKLLCLLKFNALQYTEAILVLSTSELYLPTSCKIGFIENCAAASRLVGTVA